MNENEIYVVREYKFDNRLITEIDSIIDKSFEIVITIIFIILNIVVYMILNLKISLIMK